ncbi:Uncharacterized protein C1orf43-like protein [Trichoplax sp. H2]|nr:Uncharacterized protein C1orf43-like protein [Trichoplax sp. H2]|eukprot:RDD36950.1 Uncharacterized protein C1orf43-like protein [Trichoplax sp. H2]
MSTINTTTATTTDSSNFDLYNRRYGVFIIAMIIMGGLEVMILILRVRQRFVLINARKPHTIIGSDAAKTMRKGIQNSLERTVQSLCEPSLLRDMQPTKDHHYRMKVLDEVVALNDIFLEMDGHLLRPVGRDFREHLSLLRRFYPSIFDGREALYSALSAMYEHARFIAKPFGRREYDRFHRLLDYLIKLIRRIKQVDANVSSSDLDVSIPHAPKTTETRTLEEDNAQPSTSSGGINITRNKKRLSSSPKNKSTSRSSNKDDDSSSSAHVVVTGISSKDGAVFV